jgi:hypothetical protein
LTGRRLGLLHLTLDLRQVHHDRLGLVNDNRHSADQRPGLLQPVLEPGRLVVPLEVAVKWTSLGGRLFDDQLGRQFAVPVVDVL